MATFEADFDFSTPGDYSHVNTEILLGILKLTAPSTAGRLFTQAFASDSGFTYDSAKAEFVGGLLRKKDQTPATSVIAAKFPINANPVTTEANLNWHKSGSVTATLNGAPTIASGELVCSGTQGVYYAKTSATRETFRAKVRTPFTGGPAANIDVMSCSPASGNADRFNLTYSPSGNNLRITLYNSSGAVVISVATTIGGTLSAVLNQQYEMAVVLDSVAGTVRFFVNGTLHGTLSPGAWTRGGVALRYYLGANPVMYNTSNLTLDDFIVYDSALWTASYTSGYTLVDTIYAESKADLPIFTHQGPGDIQSLTTLAATEVGAPQYIVDGKYWNGSAWVASDGSFAQSNTRAVATANFGALEVDDYTTLNVSVVFAANNTLDSVDDLVVTYFGNAYSPSGAARTELDLNANEFVSIVESGLVTPVGTSVKAGVYLDGVLKYWNGSAVVTSNGTLAQLNTFAELTANAAEFVEDVNSVIDIHIRMETSDLTVTPELDSFLVTYDFGGVVVEPAVCLVWGFCRDVSGDPVSGVKVRVLLVRSDAEYVEANEGNIVTSYAEVTSGVDGYFEINLIRSSEYENPNQLYMIKTLDSQGTRVARDINGNPIEFSVPDATSKVLTDLIVAA